MNHENLAKFANIQQVVSAIYSNGYRIDGVASPKEKERQENVVLKSGKLSIYPLCSECAQNIDPKWIELALYHDESEGIMFYILQLNDIESLSCDHNNLIS